MPIEKHAVENQNNFRSYSSVADDVWRPAPDAPGGYEWWYFDAISDDGRDVLVVIFLADFVFSPRFNRAVAEHRLGRGRAPRTGEFPAVSVCLYRDGRLLFRANNEHAPADFSARRDWPACRIGRSSFQLVETPQGLGYDVTLDEVLRGGRRLGTALSWEVTDGDFSRRGDELKADGNDPEVRDSEHEWNMVAPRCRVEGTISFSGGRDGSTETQRFSGTGYHDHNRDARWMPATVAEWQWGRVHFDDRTSMVFYRYREHGEQKAATHLFVVRNGEIESYNAQLKMTDVRRHHFGVRYPRDLEFMTDERGGKTSLLISQRRVVEGSYFYLRFLADATLDAGDGRVQRAPALTEHLAPRAMRWRWLDWLTSMRIGRNGRTSFLK